MSGPVNPIFYRCFVKANAFTASERLHRLRAVREALSDEQRRAERRQAGLGQELHPLHGVHLLLPGQTRSSTAKKSVGQPRYHFEAL